MNRLLLVLFLILLLLCIGLVGGCQPRQRSVPAPAPPAQTPLRLPPVAEPAPPGAKVLPLSPAPPEPRPLPRLDHEPRLYILVHRAPQGQVKLHRSFTTTAGQVVPAGTYSLRAGGGGVQLGTVLLTAPADLRPAAGAGASFSINGRNYAGGLRLARDAAAVAVCEELGMEDYLLGVLAKEVEPDWPLEALKAQAVAARSYAACQWLRRQQQAWHLDGSEQVDMAYAGYLEQPHRNLQAAVAQTRGNLLWYAGQPVPAFFHAASGGHTEDITHVWPERRCPDGLTRPGPAMPPRLDPWDAAGRQVAPRRLGAWKATLPLTELARLLQAAGQPPIGAIRSLRLSARDDASSRARRVRVEGESGHLDLSAHQLRMAVGSTTVRSTLWRDFRVDGGQLIIQGHGYGHGVGLPQASAWAMANAGRLAPEILKFFYSGASLVDRY